MALFFYLCSLGGCDDTRKTVSSIKDQANHVYKSVMDCIKNKNTKELKEMFCEKLLSNYDDIDSDINNFFEFIDGNIVSYNGPEYAEEGAKDNGIWTKYWVEPYTRNIKTDHNKE